MDRYRESLSDPELLNLRSEISLLDARVGEVLNSLDTGESGRLWRELQSLRSLFLTAQRKRDEVRMAESLNDLLSAIGRGSADF